MSPFIILLLIVQNACSEATPSPTTCTTSIDLILMLDSSGSIYNVDHTNWQNELNTAKSIVSSIPTTTNSRVGLINFSGCRASTSGTECKKQGKFIQKMWTLNDFGNPNNLTSVINRIDEMGPSDYTGGNTWPDQALQVALTEFKANSSNETSKIIILITNGNWEDESSHAPCMVVTNYISPTLKSLQTLGVKIITIAVAIAPELIDNFFKCLVDDSDKHFIKLSDFASLSTITVDICSISVTTMNAMSSKNKIKSYWILVIVGAFVLVTCLAVSMLIYLLHNRQKVYIQVTQGRNEFSDLDVLGKDEEARLLDEVEQKVDDRYHLNQFRVRDADHREMLRLQRALTMGLEAD